MKHIDPVTKDVHPVDEETEYDLTRVKRYLDKQYPGLLDIGCYYVHAVDMIVTECGYVSKDTGVNWRYCPRCGRRVAR